MLGSRLIPSESYRDRRAAQKEKKAKAAASGSARPQVGSGTPSVRWRAWRAPSTRPVW